VSTSFQSYGLGEGDADAQLGSMGGGGPVSMNTVFSVKHLLDLHDGKKNASLLQRHSNVMNCRDDVMTRREAMLGHDDVSPPVGMNDEGTSRNPMRGGAGGTGRGLHSVTELQVVNQRGGYDSGVGGDMPPDLQLSTQAMVQTGAGGDGGGGYSSDMNYATRWMQMNDMYSGWWSL